MRKSIVGSRRLIVPENLDDESVRAAIGATVDDEGASTWSSVLHDTADFELLRRGITVERVRPVSGAGHWVARFPYLPSTGLDEGPRIERLWPLSGVAVPSALAAAVAPLVQAPLLPVARTRTRRRRLRPGGDLPAVVNLDTVELLAGRRVLGAVRVVDVAPADGLTLTDLDRLDLALREAGATRPPGGTAIAVLLGEPAQRPAAPSAPALQRSSRCAEVVVAALVADVQLLLHHWPMLHLTPTGRTVHSSRVALRRYRSHLRLFGPLLDHDRRVELDSALRSLADSLGPVRELDVLVELVGDLALALDDTDRDVAHRLVDLVAARRASALGGLRDAVAGDAAIAAVRSAVAFASAPPIVDRGDEPGRAVVTQLARRSWRRLATAAASLDETSPAVELHELRLLAKRARYATEVAGRLRPAAARHAVELRRLQSLLGDINDVDVAAAQLRTLAVGADDTEVAFVTGLLVGELRRRGERRRAAWPAQWERTTRKGVRGWLGHS